MNALPRTPSGKLDRKRIARQHQTAIPYDLPITQTESLVLRIWSDLGVSAQSGADEFFAGGGHSLLLMRLATRLQQETGVVFPLRDLFTNSTVRALATLIDSARARTRLMEAGS
jgi:acyl carrier protein